MPGAEPFLAHRTPGDEVALVPCPCTATGRQHESGIRSTARGRFRLCDDGRGDALRDHGVSKSAAAMPGVSGPARIAAGTTQQLETIVRPVPQANHVQDGQAPGAQITAAHGPY